MSLLNKVLKLFLFFIAVVFLMMIFILIYDHIHTAQAADSMALNCAVGEETIALKYDKAGAISKYKCFSQAEYKNEKKRLLDSYNKKGKTYDFDIKDRELLGGILDKEIKKKGGMSLTNVDKNKLREELIKLLQ